MEKQPILTEEKPPQFLTKTQQEIRKEVSEDILLCAPSELGFFVFWQSKNIIAVGIKGRHFGMWLFDANSHSEVEVARAEGFEITENPCDLILEGKTAEISEVEKKMPEFLPNIILKFFL